MGVIQWMYSWQVDGKTNPAAFAYPKGQGPANFNKIARPPKGTMGKRPPGKKAKAKHLCRSLKQNKKAFAKCIFDYLVLGPKACKRNLRDRMAKRRFKGKKAKAAAAEAMRNLKKAEKKSKEQRVKEKKSKV